MARFEKVLLLTVLVVGAALAEPAFRRQQAQQAQQAPQDGDAEDAPYAPSGWKPSGQRLELPARATKPGSQYGGPAEELDATAEPAESATETPSDDGKKRGDKLQQQQAYQGEYYVILPDGRLQRVQFAARLEAPGAARAEQADETAEQTDEADEQADEPAAPARPRPSARPAARPQSATAAPLLQGRYFVVLADGSLQEVQLSGRLEEAGPSRSGPAGPRRPQPQPQPLQQPGAAGVPSSFVASLRFMEVPPIAGPVFSYSGPLVRVQREI